MMARLTPVPCLAALAFICAQLTSATGGWPVVVSRRTPFDCPQPCSCPQGHRTPQCHAGVTVVTDGCGCCQICARQAGEDCDERLVCDPAKDLICSREAESDGGGGVGFCRKRIGGHVCHVNGQAFRDGQTFNSTCRYRCLCQDGRVACSDVCAHQTHRPPAAVCQHSSLVSIPGRCCKEWICETAVAAAATASAVSASAAETASRGAVGDEEVVARKSRHGQDTATRVLDSSGCPQQNKVVTKWSACSTTCGVGVSSRLSNDNAECQTIRETRLCMMAECVVDPASEEQSCRSTVRADQPMHLTYIEDATPEGRPPVRCRSVRLWKPKFCSGCHRRRCCRPLKAKTKTVEFQCEDGIGRARQWAWIKRCVCTTRGCHRL